MTSPTRKDYMSGKVSHRDFYAAVANTAGLKFSPADPFIAQVRHALARGDEHLNTINLRIWDMKGAQVRGLDKAFKAHGDHDSLAGRVCVLKEAARQAAEVPHKNPIAKPRKFSRRKFRGALKRAGFNKERVRRSVANATRATGQGNRMGNKPRRNPKMKKRPSPAQIAARKRFTEMVRNRAAARKGHKRFAKSVKRAVTKLVRPFIAIEIRPGKIEFYQEAGVSQIRTTTLPNRARKFNSVREANSAVNKIAFATQKRCCVVTGKTTMADLKKLFAH